MFEPSLRNDPATIQLQSEKILKSDMFAELLRTAPNIIMILNEYRQVVYLNRSPVANRESLPDTTAGPRPGECLMCINSHYEGCGSSEFCMVCGFNLAISASENGENGSNECNIHLENGSTLTLSVSTRPFTCFNEKFTFCALEDISEKKRRQMLESVFLHDILNTAAILRGLSQAYDSIGEQKARSMLSDVSENIRDEVQSYRLISNAENQKIKPDYTHVDIEEIVSEVAESMQRMQKFRQRNITITTTRGNIYTERTLLRRVLINMVKNALEASDGNDIVKISARMDQAGKRAEFSVSNPQVIPRADQLKLFQKSFSTKGSGRGWGTYSIKILTEKYLKGKVSFSSGKSSGTIFTVSIPQAG